MVSRDYTHVTEIAGQAISREQLQRMVTRYRFARQYCCDKKVLELACGSGQGLGLLAGAAAQLAAGDYSWPLVGVARAHYQHRVPLVQLDAQKLPFKARQFDVVLLYEALYYLKRPADFFIDCHRILRNGGRLIICSANKDLPDFNPSTYSVCYFSPSELCRALQPLGFSVSSYGDYAVDYGTLRQKLLSAVKQRIVRWHLMPTTMRGKKLLKRLVFGKLIPMPAEITLHHGTYAAPVSISNHHPDTTHKVLFTVAQKTALA